MSSARACGYILMAYRFSRVRFGPLVGAVVLAVVCGRGAAQVAVKAKTLHTMTPAGTITDGVVVITDGKIVAVGKASETPVPAGHRIVEGAVATPGLIDSRGTVGVSGLLNQKQDQDQLERSSPIQPELRAIDAFNPNDRLVEWVRSLGITTIHTGHAPGELISGQTCVVKTTGKPVEECVVVETATIAATIGPWSTKSGSASPGSRAKQIAMLREELIKAREYIAKREAKPAKAGAGEEDKKSGDRNLRAEAMARVLKGELPLLITANQSQDITSALRLAKEFDIRLILDSGAEAYLLTAEIKAAGVPVILHATMFRAVGDMENMSRETAAALTKAGIRTAIQSGYESYVPKSRVVLFEAAQAAANGMTFDEALATITTRPAEILGIEGRVGSLKVGLDGDVAVYDGDPFEYTTHCVGVVIDGRVVSEVVR